MIVGKGQIFELLQGKWFSVTPFYTTFAAGVGSHETKNSEFEREELLLLNQNYDTHLIYFSTLAIYYPGKLSPFATHKLAMEEKIKKLWKKYTIIRLGDLTWSKKSTSLLNDIRHRLANNLAIECKDEYRYLTTKEDLLLWLVNFRQGERDTINVPSKAMKIVDIIEMVKAETPLYKGGKKDLDLVNKHIAEQEKVPTELQMTYVGKTQSIACNHCLEIVNSKTEIPEIQLELMNKIIKLS